MNSKLSASNPPYLFKRLVELADYAPVSQQPSAVVRAQSALVRIAIFNHLIFNSCFFSICKLALNLVDNKDKMSRYD